MKIQRMTHDLAHTPREDLDAILRIAERVHSIYPERLTRDERAGLVLFLIIVHRDCCPLRLDELAAADDFNLLHDVCGLQRHFDYDTRTLTECFTPRYAKP